MKMPSSPAPDDLATILQRNLPFRLRIKEAESIFDHNGLFDHGALFFEAQV